MSGSVFLDAPARGLLAYSSATPGAPEPIPGLETPVKRMVFTRMRSFADSFANTLANPATACPNVVSEPHLPSKARHRTGEDNRTGALGGPYGACPTWIVIQTPVM